MRPSIALIAAVACLPFFAVQAKEKPATLPAKDKSEAAQTKDKHVPVSTTFTTDANTKVRVGDNKSATLADIKVGAKVHVTGISKGKGFAGVMKRHHFKGGRATHGSMFHRAPGSIGGSSYPSRVWPGMRMGGQMGNEQVTVRNLEIAKVDAENNLLLIKGAVPGPKGGYVVIKQEA